MALLGRETRGVSLEQISEPSSGERQLGATRAAL